MKTVTINRLLIFLVSALTILVTTGTTFSHPTSGNPENLSLAPPDGVPLGTIVAWAGDPSSLPRDWRICDGEPLRVSEFAGLHNAIGTSWGGARIGEFNLPDLRGLFLRGVDGGAGRDPDASRRSSSAKGGNRIGVGSIQEAAAQDHTHRELKKGHSHAHTHKDKGHTHAYQLVVPFVDTTIQALNGSFEQDDFNTLDPETSMGKANLSKNAKKAKVKLGGAIAIEETARLKVSEETRPKNAYVHWIIKVR